MDAEIPIFDYENCRDELVRQYGTIVRVKSTIYDRAC
jgi:hypothetical protein